MLRLINKFNLLVIVPKGAASYYQMPYNPALLPVKKSHRKPRWIPVAKSKVFRVPVRKEYPEDETQEILRLFNNYRNNVKSIRKFLRAKHCTDFQLNLDPEEILKEFKEDLQQCHKINDEWNAEIKVKREARVQQELEKALAAAREDVIARHTKQDQIYELAESLVRKEKEASVTFITPDNIDAAIDKALNETVDYNYAIDIDGNRIIGKKTRPTPVQDNVAISQ